MTPKFHTLKVREVKREIDDAVSVSFEVPEPLKNDFQFEAGQYLTLKQDIDGEEVRRSYSICTAPHEDDLRVAVKWVPGGKFSTYANETLKPGDELDVMTPTGKFTTAIEPKSRKSYVFFAAGSGITPIMSLIKTVLKEEKDSDVVLFYGNKGAGSIIFKEELEGLKNIYINRFRLVHILSRENIGVPIQHGRIDKDKSNELCRIFVDVNETDHFYICGPEPMIHAVKEYLTDSKVDASKIHFELFGTTASSAPKERFIPEDAPVVDSQIELTLDGEIHSFGLNFRDKAILDAAQEHGADVPFACKGGVCCTCRAKVLEGEVIMDVNYALEKDELDAGYVLTCQSHPKTDKVRLSFDE